MSTWISSLGLALGLATLATAAATEAAAQQRGLRIAPPPGYCVDREAHSGPGIVLIGRCAGVANRPPAVLTVAMGKPASGLGIADQGKALAEFFTSQAGRAALSRGGRAQAVTVLEALTWRDAFLIRWRDSAAGRGAQGESWRAVLGLDGRLLTLTVTGTAAAPLNRDEGRKLIEGFVTAMTSANRRSAQGGD
ncbi:MAG: hypothetical protein JG765_1073 [Cereibacter sp.]|jgi:hypothetical protein|nr:hypothetical protein [Cereibacter sp.]